MVDLMTTGPMAAKKAHFIPLTWHEVFKLIMLCLVLWLCIMAKCFHFDFEEHRSRGPVVCSDFT